MRPAPINAIAGALAGAIMAGSLIALFGLGAGLALALPGAIVVGAGADSMIYVFARLEREHQAVDLVDRERLP